jgi:glycosyl transferase, family 25
MEIQDFFAKAYVINLVERRDRRRDMTNNFKKIGWKIEPQKTDFFPAIKPIDSGKFPSVGAKGCFLSHLQILKQAQADGLQNVLVMEDDLNISQQLVNYQKSLLAQLNDLNWDFVYLGHREKIAPESNSEIKLVEYSQPIVTAHFYALNGRILPRLIAFLELIQERSVGHPEGGPMHLDGAYSTFRAQNSDIVTLIANPSLGSQRSSHSDIAKNKWFERLPGLRELTIFARQGREWLANKQ